MNSDFIKEYRWRIVCAVTEDHGNHPYPNAVMQFFTKELCSTLFEGELIYRYLQIIKEESKKIPGYCSPEAIEMAIMAKYQSNEDPQDIFYRKQLIERCKQHQQFSRQIRKGKHLSLLTTLRDKILSLAKQRMVEFYSRQLVDAHTDRRIALAKEIVKVERMVLPEKKVAVFGTPTPRVNNKRVLRPTYVDWIDEHIRNGKGLALYEQLLIHMRSNGGKGVLSSQIGYQGALNGLNCVIFYNEDNHEKVKTHILAKILGVDPLELSGYDDERLERGYAELNRRLKGRLVLRKVSSKELELDTLENIVTDTIHEYELHNPRIIFDYLSLIKSPGRLASESWAIDLDAFNMFEQVMDMFDGDMAAFEQNKPEYNEKQWVKPEMIQGAKAKTQKARHIIGIGAREQDLRDMTRFANITKVTGGGKYGKVDLIFNPIYFTLEKKK